MRILLALFVPVVVSAPGRRSGPACKCSRATWTGRSARTAPFSPSGSATVGRPSPAALRSRPTRPSSHTLPAHPPRELRAAPSAGSAFAGVTPEGYSLASQGVQQGQGSYPLRPELAESTYYLYRATSDPTYLMVRCVVVAVEELHDSNEAGRALCASGRASACAGAAVVC